MVGIRIWCGVIFGGGLRSYFVDRGLRVFFLLLLFWCLLVDE
jgi:hypothetical protein